MQALERYRAIERFIVCAIDYAHSALADHLVEAINGNARAGRDAQRRKQRIRSEALGAAVHDRGAACGRHDRTRPAIVSAARTKARCPEQRTQTGGAAALALLLFLLEIYRGQ